MRIIMITESAEHVSDYSLNHTMPGCTDYNGKRRAIWEEWKGEGDGCNNEQLVSNSTYILSIGLFSNHCSCTCGEDGKPYCSMTRMSCTFDEPGLKTETGEDPAGNNEGCTDENGKRRKIGEKWSTKIGCNSGRLVSN